MSQHKLDIVHLRLGNKNKFPTSIALEISHRIEHQRALGVDPGVWQKKANVAGPRGTAARARGSRARRHAGGEAALGERLRR